MRISEIIEQLEEFKAHYGDVTVGDFDGDFQQLIMHPTDEEGVGIGPEEKCKWVSLEFVRN